MDHPQQRLEPGVATVMRTRAEVVSGWKRVARILHAIGDHKNSDPIHKYLSAMRPPMTVQQGLFSNLQEKGGSWLQR